MLFCGIGDSQTILAIYGRHFLFLKYAFQANLVAKYCKTRRAYSSHFFGKVKIIFLAVK